MPDQYEWRFVSIAGMEGRAECIHRAYLNPCDSWNGWLCPFFEKDEVRKMEAWLSEFDDSLLYDTGSDTFSTTYDPENVERFVGQNINGIHLYPIGYASWAWVFAHDQTLEANQDLLD